MLYYFPKLEQDETLYSGWSRYSKRTGEPGEAITSSELFGEPSRNIRFRFEKRIDAFASNLPDGLPYSSDYLTANHTLFPLYEFTLPKQKAMEFKRSMKGDERRWIGGQFFVHAVTNLPKFARYCIDCAREDIKACGEPYWHRLHQIRDIDICPDHQCWLEDTNLEANIWGLGLVTARRCIDLTRSPKYLDLETGSYEYFQLLFARNAKYLLEHPAHSLYLENVRERYKSILFERGLASAIGTIYKARFQDYVFSKIPRDTLQKLQEHLYGFRRIWFIPLVPGKRPVPPAFHFLIMYILDVAPNSFIEHSEVIGPFGPGPWPCKNPYCKKFNKPVIHKFTLRYHDGKKYGAFDCECGFSYQTEIDEQKVSRTSVTNFGPVWTEQISKSFGGRNPTTAEINDILGFGCSVLQPYDTAIRQEKRRLAQRNEFRSQCLKLLSKFPNLTRHQLCKKNGKLYWWMIQKDRPWFDEHSRAAKSGNFTPRTPISNWKEYDKNLVRRLNTVYKNEIASDKRPKRISSNYLLRQAGMAPSTITSYRARGQLPVTSQFLERVCESREQYISRQVEYAVRYYVEKGIIPTRTKYRVWFRLKNVNPEIKSYLEEGYDRIISTLKSRKL